MPRRLHSGKLAFVLPDCKDRLIPKSIDPVRPAIIRTCLLIMTVICLPFAALAEVPGDQNPLFRSAIRAWLSGTDDHSALTDLAALAQADNIAAQITLGLIARQPQTYGHVFKTLTRAAQRRIFHKDNGRFGRRWLTVAAEVDPLAALLSRNNTEDYYALSHALAEEGALKRAYDFAGVGLNQEGSYPDFFRALSHPRLVTIMKPIIHTFSLRFEDTYLELEDEESARELRDIRRALPDVTIADRILMQDFSEIIPFEDLPQATDPVRLRGAALLHHPGLASLSQLVTEACPDDTAYHMGLLYHLKGSTALQMDLLSPFLPMISTEDWQQSGRFRADYLRLWSGAAPKSDMLRDLSPCFAEAIQSVR